MTFCIKYTRSSEKKMMVAWGAEQEPKWGLFQRDEQTNTYKYIGPLSSEAYDQILIRFGLVSWRWEFLLGDVLTMSPEKLIAERRKKEQERRISQIEIVSDDEKAA